VSQKKQKNSKILVVGSSNTDMVIKAQHLPRPGETVLGGTFFMNPGGKGANQAVAIARLGGQIAFICKTGGDIFGHQSHQLFEEEGIDVSYVFSDANSPSGVALITVDEHAENCIVVASGANANLLPADLAKVEEAVDMADFILMQLEIPIETVEFVAEMAAAKNKKVILNPAPAQILSTRLLQNLHLITPNETEAELISGIKISDRDSAEKAAKKIVEMGVNHVIITLGSKGAFVYGDGVCEMVAARPVKAIDTTAAGDIFNGALVVALAENRSLIEAVHFACKAAAISVTRTGAQSSAPYRNEVDVFNSK
jgi:ribokinase